MIRCGFAGDGPVGFAFGWRRMDGIGYTRRRIMVGGWVGG